MFKHFLITRFNLGLRGNCGKNGVSAKQWMRERKKLFWRFTVPSVAAQTERNFTWLILLDEGLPQIAIPEAAVAVYGRGVADGLEKAMRIVRGAQSDFVITSRLDNDDAIHRDYAARVQASVEARHLTAINFDGQFIYDMSNRRMHERPRGFCTNTLSLVEQTNKNPRGIYQHGHGRAYLWCEVKTVGGRGLSLVLVHGGNIKNRVKGKMLMGAPGSFRDGYPWFDLNNVENWK